MRFEIKRGPAKSANLEFVGPTNPANPEFVDIPVVTWGTIITAIISVVVAISTGFLPAYCVTKPNNEAVQRLEKQKFQSELLQKALQVEESQDRAQALSMLLGLGLLDDPSQKIQKYIDNPDTIPQWSSASSERKAPSSASGGEKSNISK